jgi:secondary thiamine-phosphate synthase enzyme
MNIVTETINLMTKGRGDMIDITNEINSKLCISNGIINISVVGSTASVTTIEYEPGLKKDFPAILDELIPDQRDWAHHGTWGDRNGGAHLKASIIGPSVTLPVVKGKMQIGTWQQVVVLDFDEISRSRNIILQMLGE